MEEEIEERHNCNKVHTREEFEDEIRVYIIVERMEQI